MSARLVRTAASRDRVNACLPSCALYLSERPLLELVELERVWIGPLGSQPRSDRFEIFRQPLAV
jgi:hypothetical protein